MAYGVCYAIGCNYQNVTVTYLAGNTSSYTEAVYAFVFYADPAAAPVDYASALTAALPSLNSSAPGTVAYGMAFTQGGSIGTNILAGVRASYGSYAPPPPAHYACTCTGGYSGVDCKTAPGGVECPFSLTSAQPVDFNCLVNVTAGQTVYGSLTCTVGVGGLNIIVSGSGQTTPVACGPFSYTAAAAAQLVLERKCLSAVCTGTVTYYKTTMRGF